MDFKDLEETPEKVTKMAGMVAVNAAYLPGLLKAKPYPGWSLPLVPSPAKTGTQSGDDSDVSRASLQKPSQLGPGLRRGR